MTTILRRLKLVMKVWVNKLLASAEDPRQVFTQAYHRQKELLAGVQRAQQQIARSRQQLESKTAGAREKLPQLEEQARQALKGGREDIARFALQLRGVAVDDLQQLEDQVSELEQEERALFLVEQNLRTQIEAFFSHQEVLMARYTTAEAHVRINEAMSGISEELAGLGTAMERVERTTRGHAGTGHGHRPARRVRHPGHAHAPRPEPAEGVRLCGRPSPAHRSRILPGRRRAPGRPQVRAERRVGQNSDTLNEQGVWSDDVLLIGLRIHRRGVPQIFSCPPLP